MMKAMMGKVKTKQLGIAAKSLLLLPVLASLVLLGSCADVKSPGARSANIPSPAMADPRPEAINEQPDSVIYLPLGSDVLVPEVMQGEPYRPTLLGRLSCALKRWLELYNSYWPIIKFHWPSKPMRG